MKLKTYGVSGLMDWTTQIKAGKGSVSVHFSGGALTAYGVTPAKFSTANVFFQNVIENSEQYRSGRIVLLSSSEVPDDAATKARNALKSRLDARESPVLPDSVASGGVAAVADGDEKSSSCEEAAVLVPTASEGEFTKIEVPDKYEAVEYLKENFPSKGYTASGLRTKAAFESACRECGIEFVFMS